MAHDARAGADGSSALGGYAVIDLTVSDWVQISVAVGTLLLAAATFYMALKTRDVAGTTRSEAEQTRRIAQSTERQARGVAEQVGITRASLEASIQPWLTRVSPPILPPRVEKKFYSFAEGEFPVAGEEPHVVDVTREGERGLRVTLWLRNVGSGVALVGAGDKCVIQGRSGDGFETRFGFASAAALPPGEVTRLAFIVQNVDVQRFLSTDRNHGEFWVKVLYTDVHTRQPVWANVHLTATDAAAEEWLFHRIDYVHDGESAPFASVQFDAAVSAAPL